MSASSRRRFLGLAGASTAGVLLSGCGLSAGSAVPLQVAPGSIGRVPGLAGERFTVGSKDFTEQRILGYIAEFALSAAGARVRDLTNITGSASARTALVNGEIDLLWDYTGSSWISYNGMTDPIKDPVEQYRAVKRLDERRNGITWTAPAFGVDNTYAIAVNRRNARRLGVETSSDLARLAERAPDQATFCVESEFASRNDGLPGLAEAYGFEVRPQNVKVLSAGAIYKATAIGNACTFGEVFTTDGRIEALDLVVLADDRQFFPRYNLGMTLRTSTLREYPQLTSLFRPISARLDNAVLKKLNAAVDVHGRDPADVARDWMVQEGFVALPGS